MRRSDVTCGPAVSQSGGTALVAAARGGHAGVVELLLDRGADLEAKHEVSAVAVCFCAQRRAERCRWARGNGDDDGSGRGAPVACQRGRRRWLWGEGGEADACQRAMVRRGDVTYGPAVSQYDGTALVAAASGGHKDTVEMMLDRGADLEAESRVSAACRVLLRDWPRWASRVGGCNGDDDSLGRGAPVAGRRGRRRWWRGMPVGEWRCDAVM